MTAQEIPSHLLTLNNLLVNVHRAGQVVSCAQFRTLMLDEMQALMPFDVACWVEASTEPLEIHHVCLHGCGPEWLRDYRPVMGEDPLLAAMLEHPGQTIDLGDLLSTAKRTPMRLYQAFRTTHGLQSVLGTLWEEPLSGLVEFLILGRHDAGHPFSEDERQSMELLMPHLTQAYRVARFRGAFGESENALRVWALADERGYLREAAAGFIHALRARWPDWQGGRLPEALLESVRLGDTWTAKRLTIEVTPKNRFRHLEIRPASPLDRLSPRESEIARRYARGDTHVAIARELGVSPSTVRNQLANCYSKLGVASKVELAARIRQPNTAGTV